MLIDEYIKKFICILWLLISVPLFGHYYIDIKNLLNKARNIEDMKKDIVVNFPKQERFTILRSNQRPKRLAKRFAGLTKPAELIKPAARSTNINKSSVGINWDYIHLNLKFGPTSTKLEK